jgi:hypothetical protein
MFMGALAIVNPARLAPAEAGIYEAGMKMDAVRAK